MTVSVNGNDVEIIEGMTLLQVLESRDISPDTVVVERNREIVPGDAYGKTVLSDGDHIEVLRFVGGG